MHVQRQFGDSFITGRICMTKAAGNDTELQHVGLPWASCRQARPHETDGSSGTVCVSERD